MKKIYTILVACILLVVSNVSAQKITPIQLKHARMSVHQWVRDYDIYAQMAERRNPTKKFTSLFENADLQIMNDYLPSISDKGSVITVHEYAKLVANKSSKFTMRYNVANAHIVSETLVDRKTLEFVVAFDKQIEFVERNSYDDDRYIYPEKSYQAQVTIRYDLRTEQAVAVAYESDVYFDSIVILRDITAAQINQYTTVRELDSHCLSQNTPLIKWSYSASDFDSQFYHYEQDTIKRNLHFGLDGGLSFAAAKFDALTSKLSNDVGATYGMNIGLYHQLSFKHGKRWGMEYDFHISCAGIGISGEYTDTYSTIDPDGGIYQRKIALNNYDEQINRYAVEIPIALRYDWMFCKDLSFYTRFGVDVSFDFYQNTKATAKAYYSGCYDWLFGVTIDQNGIYDFGQFDLQASSITTSLNRLSVGAFLGVGIQYFIPESKWSLQCGLHYGCKMYNGLFKSEEVHLSKDINDWQSATALYKYFFGQKLSAQLQLNYNF